MSDRTCSVEGCDRPSHCRSWCQAHYSRFMRYGDPLGSGKPIGLPRGRVREEAPCKVDGCDRPKRSLGYCDLHHQRFLRDGTPGPVGRLPKGPRRRDVSERFWSKVRKTETCWLWLGATMKNGYGLFNLSVNGSTTHKLAHRWAYQALVGPVAAGLELDHICHNRACVRPAHLQPVTPTLNNQNRGCVNKNSTTGVRGVSFEKARGLYSATAGRDGKTYHAGRFSTIAEAEAAAIELRNRLMTNNLLDRSEG